MSTGDSPIPEATYSKGLPTGSTVAEALAEFRRVNGLSPLSEQQAAELPPWTDEEAEAFERTIRQANYPPMGLVGGPTVTEALDDYWHSRGMTPPDRKKSSRPVPWPEEDAAAFEKVINDLFERIEPEPPLL